jgi:hypothetical protein
MKVKASAALIFAAGLLMGVAGPLPAAAADAPPDSARGISAAMSENASTVPQAATDKPAEAETTAEPGATAADQSTTFDRSLTPSEQPATATTQGVVTQGVVLASTSRASSDAQAASNDSSTLDRTSMIGKIFIAIGALLTVASAARMFMA